MAASKLSELTEVAPEIFVSEGVLARRQPTQRDRADIGRGLAVIAARSVRLMWVKRQSLPIITCWQSKVWRTDSMLARIAEMRSQRRVTTRVGTGVLVKAPKPGQDRRFDLPAIGPRTVENAARAGLAGVAVTAGSSLIAAPMEVIAAADRADIFVVGVSEAASP